jgi:tetratricopeptide (TPR) repeat protein
MLEYNASHSGLAEPLWTNLIVRRVRSLEEEFGRRACLDIASVNGSEDKQFDGFTPYETFRTGEGLTVSGQYAAAANWLRRAITGDGRDRRYAHKAYSLWIKALMQQGYYKEAEAAYSEARWRYPDDGEILFRCGILRHLAGDLPRAIGCYRASIGQVHRPRGWGEWDASIGNYKAQHNMALAHHELGEAEKARDLWRQIISIAPRFRAAHLAFGELLVATQKHIEAVVLAREMQTKGFVGDAQVLKSQIAEAQGDTFEARRHLEAGVRYAPEELLPLRKLCAHFFKYGPEDEVEPAFRELTIRAPNEAISWFNLGNYYLRSSRFEEAIESFRKALELRPSFSEAATNLAHALKTTGKEHEAQEVSKRHSQPERHGEATRRRAIPPLLEQS